MARVHTVAKAQPRYKTVPVTDDNGEQKTIPVMSKRTGEQKTTKHGKAVTRRLTVEDKSQPLPLRKCDAPGCKHVSRDIEIGTPYKWVQPKSGPYGGSKKFRHGDCPTWQPWELSQSTSARIQQIVSGVQGMQFSDPEDVRGALESAAEEIRSLAEEKRDGAQNIESGFGHPTQQSEELESLADELESWADEIEEAEVPDLPEPDEVECEECGGTGNAKDHETDQAVQCENCDGAGNYVPDEPTEDQMDEWRSEVDDALSILDNSPA